MLYPDYFNKIASQFSNGFHWAARNGYKSTRKFQKIEQVVTSRKGSWTRNSLGISRPEFDDFF